MTKPIAKLLKPWQSQLLECVA